MSNRVRQLRLVVEAPDYDQALTFYRDVLGMSEQEAYAGDGGARVAILDAGRGTLELANPAQKEMIDDVEVGRQVAGSIRVAFEVEDSAAVTDRLTGQGASLVAPPTETPWRSLNARLDAPAGLHVTLFQELADPVLAPEYPIHSERLEIRPIDPHRDVDAMHAYRSLEEVCRYVPFSPGTREEMAERLADRASSRSIIDQEGQVLALAVVRRDTGELIGDLVLFWHSATHRHAEIGYVFHPDHQGQGFATEAAEALLALAFDGLGAHRVSARIDERNPASTAVVRKLGMRQEAALVESEWFKGEWSTLLVFGMLEQEWQARGCAQHSRSPRLRPH